MRRFYILIYVILYPDNHPLYTYAFMKFGKAQSTSHNLSRAINSGRGDLEFLSPR